MFNFSVCLKITPWNFLFIFKNRFGKIPAQARGLRCWVGQSVTKKAWFCIIWTIDYVNVQLCAKESMCTSDNEILYKFPKLQRSLCCILQRPLLGHIFNLGILGQTNYLDMSQNSLPPAPHTHILLFPTETKKSASLKTHCPYPIPIKTSEIKK